MPNLIKKLKDYFYFTKSQRIGLIVLMVLLLSLIVLLFSLPYIIRVQPAELDPAFQDDVEAFLATKVEASPKRTLTPFPFNPNNISYEKLIELGLTEYQAGMIVKYRNAGGEFHKNEDFAKIYSISAEEYQKLSPFLVISVKKDDPKKKPVEYKLNPIPFDPNQADSFTFAKMGLHAKQIRQILNYRKAGGIFAKKSDFSKIYSISTDDFQVLSKYILLPSRIDTLIVEPEIKKDQEVILVELNGADTAQLITLRGIGSVYAGRIIAYREKLGGFYDKSQLLEVFGIDTSRYVQFSNHVFVDPAKIRKIELNSADFKELLQHPYLEYYIVESIFNYKDAVGEFTSVSELNQIDMIYSQLYYKIEPYLMVSKKD